MTIISQAQLNDPEEISYSVAIEVGDNYKFNHTRETNFLNGSYYIVDNNNSIDANERFIADTTITSIDVINKTDQFFGDYKDMVISTDIFLGNETLKVNESLWEVKFLNQATNFGNDIFWVVDILNDFWFWDITMYNEYLIILEEMLEFTEIGDYGYFVENNSMLSEDFIKVLDEMNFSSYWEFSTGIDFTDDPNSYVGDFEYDLLNDMFYLYVDESYFVEDINSTVEIFLDLEVNMNCSIVKKHIRSYSIMGDHNLFFADSFVFIEPLVENTSNEGLMNSNFQLFIILLALIPIFRKKIKIKSTDFFLR